MKKNIILCDFNCLIDTINEGFSFSEIQQIYLLYLLINEMDEEVVIVDRLEGNFNIFWKKKSVFQNLLQDSITTTSWGKIDFQKYDRIIVHSDLESEFLKFNTPGLFEKSFVTRSYYYHSSLNRLSKLLNTLSLDKNYIEKSKKAMKEYYLENKVELEVKKDISKVNKKIVFIPFLQSEYFLGDSFFWFESIQKRIVQLFDLYKYEKLDIVIQNKIYGDKIYNTFNNSLSDKENIVVNSLNDIQFDLYDLVLCSPVYSQKLYYYLNKEHKEIIQNKSFYIESTPNFPFLKELPNLKLENKLDQSFFNIPIKSNEKEWGERWLKEQGVKQEDAIIFLPDSASSKTKILREKEYHSLIQYFVINKKMWVLLFDEKNEGKKNKFEKRFTPEVSNKIIVVSKVGGIRNEMSILSSNQIQGMIGPCSGMTHIYNGIRLFKEKGNKENNHLVYVGASKGYNPKYHPHKWWNYSNVENIAKDKKGQLYNKITIPKNRDEYYDNILPVDEISHKDIINLWEMQYK